MCANEAHLKMIQHFANMLAAFYGQQLVSLSTRESKIEANSLPKV